MANEGLAYFIVDGYGTKTAWCVGLDTGVDIQADSSESKYGETMYPRHVTGSSFDIRLNFATHRAWREFNDWLMIYARKVSEGSVGPMAVLVGYRKFLRQGIPTKGFEYGDDVPTIVRRSNLRFEGTTDPISPGGSGSTAEPLLPDDTTTGLFYPTGEQLSAADRAEFSLYDAPSAPPAWQEQFYQAQSALHQSREP